MEWRLEFHDEAWGEMGRFTEAERQSVEEVRAWVPGGPPDDPIRVYGEIQRFEVFEHEIAGMEIVYQVHDGDEFSIIDVFRVRRRRSYR